MRFLENSVINLVNNMLRKSEVGSSIIVNIDLSFMEHYDDVINNNVVKQLEENTSLLTIDARHITAKLYSNFLFINRGGYYSCFYNEDVFKPQHVNDSKWIFESNHDTCWRDSAFSTHKENVNKITDEIMFVNDIVGLDNIDIPKHIIPNYAGISNSDIFTFTEISTNESYIDCSREHLLTINKDGKFFKQKEGE